MKLTPEQLLVLAGGLIAAAVVLLARRFRSPERADVLRGVVTVLFWDLFFILLLVLMVLMAGIVGFFLWIASLLVAMFIVVRFRQAERRALVWSMKVAAEKSIPLTTAVRFFANERRGSVARRARRLAQALDEGKTLDEALRQSGLRLPDDTLLALRMGAETGTLHESFNAAARNSANIDTTLQSVVGQIAYLTTVLLFVGGTLAFMLIKIMPAFVKILQEFHRRLPVPIIVLGEYWHIAIWACVVAALILIVAVIRYSGMLRWDPPLVRRLWRQLDEATVLRSLAVAVDRQQALPATLAMLAERYPKRHIRRRLHRAAARVSAGAEWCDALSSAGMLQRADAGVLQAAQRVGNLAWALNTTADRLVRRFMTRMTLLSSIGFPLILLIIAAAVCLLALSVFVPLTHLISSLA